MFSLKLLLILRHSLLLLASERNLTYARCEFQPWENYTVGVYNLSVTIVHDNEMDVRTNNSLQVYYYSTQDLFLTSVIPAEILKGDPPEYVTLNGSGFFDWKETVCYFGSQETRDVIYINETHLKCKVSRFVAIVTRVSSFAQSTTSLIWNGLKRTTIPAKCSWSTFKNDIYDDPVRHSFYLSSLLVNN